MHLRWIEARDFRNHRETKLEVPDGVVVAVGGNGEGKTNLLEAANYLLTLSSPRAGSDLPLVRRGSDVAYVRGEVQTATGRPLIEVEVRASGSNRVLVNRSAVRRRNDIRRSVRAVFFGPGDLAIVQADPIARRSFIDEAVATLWPAREGTGRAYERAHRQRNRLLKEWDGRGSPRGLEAWDGELVTAGSALMRARNEAVGVLSGPASEEFAALSGYGLEVGYAPSVWGDDLEQAFRGRLAERREDELIRRTSLVGPHRDDLELAVRDLGARSFASHGEAWAAALSLRLGLARAVEEEIGEPPVLILDDPFSALDPERQRRVTDRLRERGQVILSVADESHVPEGAATVWQVSSGAVTPRREAG